MPMPRLEEVDDLDGGPAYPVITGDYSATPRWESRAGRASGRRSRKPTPVFTKLDDAGGRRGARPAPAVTSDFGRGRSRLEPGLAGRAAASHPTRCRSRSSTTTPTSTSPARARSALPTVGGRSRAATAVGVDRLVQIGCDLPGARFTVEMVDRHPALLGGVALHPNEAPRLAEAGSARRGIRRDRGARRPTRGSGSSARPGWTTSGPAPKALPSQQDSFRWHIDLAKRTGKALQIHDRDAHDDVLRILDEEGAPDRNRACTASPATSRWPGRASSAATTSRSRAR